MFRLRNSHRHHNTVGYSRLHHAYDELSRKMDTFYGNLNSVTDTQALPLLSFTNCLYTLDGNLNSAADKNENDNIPFTSYTGSFVTLIYQWSNSNDYSIPIVECVLCSVLIFSAS